MPGREGTEEGDVNVRFLNREGALGASGRCPQGCELEGNVGRCSWVLFWLPRVLCHEGGVDRRCVVSYLPGTFENKTKLP